DRYFEVDMHAGGQPLSQEELRERLRRKAGVIAGAHDVIDAGLLASAQSLRAVCSLVEACANLDVPALTRAGVLVTNTPFGCGEAPDQAARRAADNLIAALGFGRIGGRPPDLCNPELLCDCC